MSDDEVYLSVRDVAEALAVCKNTITRRAKKERWDFMVEKVKGGQRKMFPLSTFPKDIERLLKMQIRMNSYAKNLEVANRKVNRLKRKVLGLEEVIDLYQASGTDRSVLIEVQTLVNAALVVKS